MPSYTITTTQSAGIFRIECRCDPDAHPASSFDAAEDLETALTKALARCRVDSDLDIRFACFGQFPTDFLRPTARAALRELAPRVCRLQLHGKIGYPVDVPHPRCEYLDAEITVVYKLFKSGNFPQVTTLTTHGVLGIAQADLDFRAVLIDDRPTRIRVLRFAACGDNRRWLQAFRDAGARGPEMIIIAVDDRYGNNRMWKQEDAVAFVESYISNPSRYTRVQIKGADHYWNMYLGPDRAQSESRVDWTRIDPSRFVIRAR